MTLRSSLLLATIVFTSACSSGTDEQFRCDGTQAITVQTASPHTVPQFSWTGSCPIWTLQVSYVDSTSTVQTAWVMATQGAQNAVLPPVTYGVTPTGATSPGALPLVTGRAYTVRISSWDSAKGQPGFVGLGSFVY